MAPVLNNRSPSNAQSENASHPSSGAPYAPKLFGDLVAEHASVFALQDGSGNGGDPSSPASQHIGSGAAPSSSPAATPSAPPPPPHKQEIDAYLADEGHRTPDGILAGLKKFKDPADQRYLLERALPSLSFVRIGEFAGMVQGNASLRGVVGEEILKRALQLQKQSIREGDRSGGGVTGENHRMAMVCAENLLVVFDHADQELGSLCSSLNENDGALFARTVTGTSPTHDPSVFEGFLAALNSVPHTPATSAIVQHLYQKTAPGDLASIPGLAHQLGFALAYDWYLKDNPDVANDEGARLEGLFKRPDVDRLVFGEPRDRQLIMRKVIKDPHVTAQLPNGTGSDWSKNKIVCEDAAKVMLFGDVTAALSPGQMKQVEHIGGILATERGQQLFLLGKAPAKAKAEALAALATHPEIDAGTFEKSKSAWPAELASTIANMYQSGDTHQEIQFVRGAFGVENLVGMTMGMSPNLKGVEGFFDDNSWDALLNSAAAGKIPPKEFQRLLEAQGISDLGLYDQKAVKAVSNKIRELANTDPPRVITMHATVFTEEFGPIQCPLFGVQTGVDIETGKPLLAYVDNTGQTYKNFQDWIDNNKLPAGRVYVPESGIPRPGANGEPVLADYDTPESTKSGVAKVIDTAALVGCFAAGVVAFVATGPVALVAGGVAVAGGSGGRP